MADLMDIDVWATNVDGRKIDRDKAYGAQCWDLWADYAMRCHGATLLATYTSTRGKYPGLAGSLVDRYPAQHGIDDIFELRHGIAGIRKGDVIIWGRTPAHPETHVAIALAAASGGLVRVMSQNDAGSATVASGAARRTMLSTAGVIGYLRPRPLPDPAKGTVRKRMRARAAIVYGAPRTTAPQVRSIPASSLVTIDGWTKGDRVSGKVIWYRVKGGWIPRTAFRTFQAATLRKLRRY